MISHFGVYDFFILWCGYSARFSPPPPFQVINKLTVDQVVGCYGPGTGIKHRLWDLAEWLERLTANVKVATVRIFSTKIHIFKISLWEACQIHTQWKGSLLPNTPNPPTLLASCEIADIQPNHIICARLYCCQLLTQISATGGKRVHHTQYTHLGVLFWVLWQNLRPVVPNQEKPHTTGSFPTTPSSIYLHTWSPKISLYWPFHAVSQM